MSGIKMQAVLALINQYDDGGKPRTFSLGYVREDGTKGYKKTCRKSGSLSTGTGSGSGKSKGSYNLKRKGLLRFYDIEGKKTFDLHLALITHYNEYRILH